MDDVIEVILELVLDGFLEIIQEPRIPKWIRGNFFAVTQEFASFFKKV